MITRTQRDREKRGERDRRARARADPRVILNIKRYTRYKTHIVLNDLVCDVDQTPRHCLQLAEPPLPVAWTGEGSSTNPAHHAGIPAARLKPRLAVWREDWTGTDSGRPSSGHRRFDDERSQQHQQYGTRLDDRDVVPSVDSGCKHTISPYSVHINDRNGELLYIISALEVFLNSMCYINPRFTYLLTYLSIITDAISVVRPVYISFSEETTQCAKCNILIFK